MKIECFPSRLIQYVKNLINLSTRQAKIEKLVEMYGSRFPASVIPRKNSSSFEGGIQVSGLGASNGSEVVHKSLVSVDCLSILADYRQSSRREIYLTGREWFRR